MPRSNRTTKTSRKERSCFAFLFPKTIWVFEFITGKPVGFREHKGNLELTISGLEFAKSLGAFFWRLPHVGETEPIIDTRTVDKTRLQS